jgi:hypothetical protein
MTIHQEFISLVISTLPGPGALYPSSQINYLNYLANIKHEKRQILNVGEVKIIFNWNSPSNQVISI